MAKPQTFTQPTSRGRKFFLWTSVLIALLVPLSFPLTYFIPLVTGTKRFALLHHLHGLAFFSWVGLYLTQVGLVRRGKLRLHRQLGTAGIALGGTMVPLGLWMATSAAARRMAEGKALPFEFSLYNLVDISVFAGSFGWGIFEATRRIEWHRRLIFVAALNLFGPAFSRIVFLCPLPYPWLDMAPNLIADALLFALAWHDRRVLGKVHPVTIWAMIVLIPFHTIEPIVARGSAWNAMAPGLFGFW